MSECRRADNITSSLFVSMTTFSPGRRAIIGVHGRSGRFTETRRDASLTKLRRPRSM